MTLFEEGLANLRAARAQAEALNTADAAAALDAQLLTGATFRPGDAVRDTVTGLGGTVAGSYFAFVSVPPAGGS